MAELALALQGLGEDLLGYPLEVKYLRGWAEKMAFEEALDRLVAAGYTQVDTVVDRKRTALPIAIARKSLRGV